MKKTHSTYELNAGISEDPSGEIWNGHHAESLVWTRKKMKPHLGSPHFDYLEKAEHTISLALHRHHDVMIR
jgi:hypothetical protein